MPEVDLDLQEARQRYAKAVRQWDKAQKTVTEAFQDYESSRNEYLAAQKALDEILVAG